MSDDQNQPLPPTPPQQSGQQNPLDVLEDIIKESKNKVDVEAEEKKKQAEAEQARQQAAIAAQKAALEQAEIEQKRQELVSELQAPESLEAERQKTEDKNQNANEKAQQDGFQIIQVGHTKI